MRKMMLFPLLTVLAFLAAGLPVFSAELPVEEEVDYPVELVWGVPPDVPMVHFEGLQREPEGESVTVDGDLLEVTLEAGNSYVIPIYAYSDEHVEGIRYVGRDIPYQINLEWLEPWNRVWYDFDDIPRQFVIAHVTELEDRYHVDFGPPEGALFADEIPRYIWFRLTPEEPGEFELTIHGYIGDSPAEEQQMTNQLICRISVEN